jgi:hypothetical protein
MQETKRMADEARKTAHEHREQAQKVGQEYQRAIEGGFEAATHAFSEMNRGFQAIAAEHMTPTRPKSPSLRHISWNCA